MSKLKDFWASTSDYGAVLLEWTFEDGTEIEFFIEPEALPTTVAEVKPNRTPAVREVRITGGDMLAALLRGESVPDNAEEAGKPS